MFKVRKSIVFAQISLLAGCASPAMHFSLEELGSESVNRSGIDGIAYRSAIVMHGLGAPVAVGGLANVPGQKLPDMMTIPVSTGCSRIIEQNYDVAPKANQSKDDTAREALEKMSSALDELVIASAERAQLDLSLALLALAKQQFAEGSDATTKAQLATLLALDADAQPETIEVKRQILLASQVQINTRLAEAKKTLNGLQGENVLLLNWSQAKELGLQATLGDIFSSNASSKQQRSGYLLIAGLRSTTLQVGDDFAIWLDRERETGRTGSDSLFKNTFIVTHQLAARQLAFREEAQLGRALATSLVLPLAQLSGSLQALIREQQVRASITLAATLQASSRGHIRRTNLQTWYYRFWGDSAQAASSHAELLRGKAYTPFYHIRADLASLASRVKQSNNPGVQCMQMIPKGSQDVINADMVTKPVTSFFCRPKEEINGLAKISSGKWKPDNERCIDFAQPEQSDNATQE